MTSQKVKSQPILEKVPEEASAHFRVLYLTQCHHMEAQISSMVHNTFSQL